MDHLFQTPHCRPQALPLGRNRGVVFQQFVLARCEPRQDRGDMRLRRFITVEIIAHLVAERNDAEQPFRRGQAATLAGVQIFDRAAQLGQVVADAAFLVHRFDGAVEKAVRLPRGLSDFVAAHIGDQIDPPPELGRIGILRDQIGHELLGLCLQLRFLHILQRNKPRCPLRRNRRNRIRRDKRDFRCLGRHSRHGCPPLVQRR